MNAGSDGERGERGTTECVHTLPGLLRRRQIWTGPDLADRLGVTCELHSGAANLDAAPMPCPIECPNCPKVAETNVVCWIFSLRARNTRKYAASEGI